MKRTEVPTWVQTDDLQMRRAPCSRKTTSTPHACIIHICLYERERRVSAVSYWNQIKANPSPTIDQLLVVVFVLGRVDFDFIAGFENAVSCRFSTTCWLSLTLSASLRCRALVGTYVLFCFVQSWLRCAMLAVDAQRQHALGVGCGFVI